LDRFYAKVENIGIELAQIIAGVALYIAAKKEVSSN
jgi:hypothetical protein